MKDGVLSEEARSTWVERMKAVSRSYCEKCVYKTNCMPACPFSRLLEMPDMLDQCFAAERIKIKRIGDACVQLDAKSWDRLIVLLIKGGFKGYWHNRKIM